MKGLRPGQLLEMLGSGDGKVNAPRLWYRKFMGFLVHSGWVIHSMDPCVAMLYRADRLIAVLGVHVGDILGGCRSVADIQHLIDRFKWGQFVWNSLVFCGREVVTAHDPILVMQCEHNRAIEVNKIPRHRRSDPAAPLLPNEKSDMVSGIGTLQWIGSNTSPPLQASVSLAQGAEPTIATLMEVNALLREACGCFDRGLAIVAVPFDKGIVVNFADGSCGNTKGGRTQSGHGTRRRKP